MPLSQSLPNLIKALLELGPRPLGLYAAYRLGLASGYYRRRSVPRGDLTAGHVRLRVDALPLPSKEQLLGVLGEDGRAHALAEADAVVAGRVRLFGGAERPLELGPRAPLAHWTEYARGARAVEVEDVKLVWEPARFGWAFPLVRAYALTSASRYAAAFWAHCGRFWDANPPYLGPHWVSAQEVAIRLIALTFAARALGADPESTPERTARLGRSIAAHAERLPLTLAYARAQNNNHLLVEAAGLYTAGWALPDHPSADRWKASGWAWWNRALQSQIDARGGYVQHSANYHRLMLQAALWVALVAAVQEQPLPSETRARLGLASDWLLHLLDPETGRAPNLGPNDGAYFLPLTGAPIADYRPVAAAAALAFREERPFPTGPWDETAFWLVPEADRRLKAARAVDLRDRKGRRGAVRPHVLVSPVGNSWAYLRAARFSGRPGHADQLHLDLWWRGQNVARDPGTYSYNAPPPWQNALSGAAVHNSVTVARRDQMRRAGRFLWLDRAQARVVRHEVDSEGRLIELAAEHDGYRDLAVKHRRTVRAREGGWDVEDEILPVSPEGRRVLPVRLHWLMADWPWELAGTQLRVRSPSGWLTLDVRVPGQGERPIEVELVRAGELLVGAGPASPVRGWMAPTYLCREPALSFSVTARAIPPVRLVTRWELP